MLLKTMRHLQHITVAVWVAGCVLLVQGFPTETTEPHLSTKNHARSLAPRGAEITGSGLSAGAEIVESGIATGVNGIDASTQITLDRLYKAFSGVNAQSLSIALGMLNVSKQIADKVDLYSILPNLITGQVQTPAGVINYETVTVFLEKLFGMVPQLKKTLEGYRTVSYVINKIKQKRSEGKQIDAANLLKGAVDTYFKDLDPAFKQKVVGLSSQIYAAACGNMDAAKKVATALADRSTVTETLKGIGYRDKVLLLQMVINKVCEYANLIKNARNANHNKSELME